MAEKKIIHSNPFSTNGVDVKPQVGFDTDYKTIKIVDKVVRVGDGEEDFSVIKVVEESFTPIQEVIDADAQSVGVYNIMRSVAFQDDNTIYADKGNGQLVDLSGAPQNLMQLKEMAVQGEANFKKLPEELTKGLDMAAFVNSMDQAQFDAFIQTVKSRLEGEKKDG